MDRLPVFQTRTHAGRGLEVSCRVAGQTIEIFEQLGRPVAIDDLPYTREHLLDVRQTISWDAYRQLLEIGCEGMAGAELEAFGHSFGLQGTAQPIASMARRVGSHPGCKRDTCVGRRW